jgi:hypothetical protein
MGFQHFRRFLSTTCNMPHRTCAGLTPALPQLIPSFDYGVDVIDAVPLRSDHRYEGPFGQAVEVPQLQTAPYTPFNNETSFKPIAGVNRYVAIEGGSFFDAVVRGFFGYHAPLQWETAGASADGDDGKSHARTPADVLKSALIHNAATPRGFVGKLSNLRTPYGLATITSDAAAGLSIELQ